MIHIVDKKECCGCEACVQICPMQCISLLSDEQGFRYPQVNLDLCIRCNLCERTCPELESLSACEPLSVEAVTNPDRQVVEASSSGGVFQMLARQVIESGGVVFGAVIDSCGEVCHTEAQTLGELTPMLGSKYVQSQTGSCFARAKALLNEGRKVLFSGTPCQIAALGLFLRKDYGDLLLTVDVICHGVPSPGVWRDYLTTVAPAGRELSKIAFRNKSFGWQKFSMRIDRGDTAPLIEPLTRNLYLRGFLSNVFLRPSCYDCPARDGRSHSDITLGDFWGIQNHHPQAFNSRGVSLVLANSHAGSQALERLGVASVKSTYAVATATNPALIHNARRPADYAAFWADYSARGIAALSDYLRSHRPPLKARITAALKNAVRPIYFRLISLIKR